MGIQPGDEQRIGCPSSQPGPCGRPEYLFLVLALTFGSIFAVVVPPTMVYDEKVHFFRSYDLSEGQVAPLISPISTRKDGKKNGWAGGILPRSVVKVGSIFNPIIGHMDLHIDRNDVEFLQQAPLEPEKREPIDYWATACNSFMPYVPSAAGIWMSRYFGGNALQLFYAGRFANLFCSVVIVFCAIRISPILKRLLTVIALLPMTICLFASFSADALTISMAFLLLAILLRLVLGNDPKPRSGHVAGMHLAGLILGLCKFPYVPITLLYLAIPRRRIGSWPKYLGLGSTLASITVLPGMFWLKLSDSYHPEIHSVPGWVCSRAEQLAYVRQNPGAFLQCTTETCIQYGKRWIDICTLPCDVVTVELAFYLLSLFVVVVALIDRTDGLEPPRMLRGLSLVTFVLSFELVLFCLYLWWNPVGSNRVEGIQGRYFIPILPLLLLLLHNPAIRVQTDHRFLMTCIFGVCSSMLVVAITSLLQRYYFAEPMFWLSPMVVCCSCTLFILASLAGRHWVYPCKKDLEPTSSIQTIYARAVMADAGNRACGPRVEKELQYAG